MKTVSLYYTTKFKKKLKDFPTKERANFLKKFKTFLDDPFEPSLKTHKLAGKLDNYWSFSLNYNLRVLFRFVNDTAVELIDMGGHDIYK